ncbi:hypothetical protein CYMTET_35346, partial [Cymbomonas tetramitiformis]
HLEAALPGVSAVVGYNSHSPNADHVTSREDGPASPASEAEAAAGLEAAHGLRSGRHALLEACHRAAAEAAAKGPPEVKEDGGKKGKEKVGGTQGSRRACGEEGDEFGLEEEGVDLLEEQALREEDAQAEAARDGGKRIMLGLAGHPNVGKSLLNHIFGKWSQ